MNEKYLKKLIIILFVFIILAVGFILPFFSHEKSFMVSKNIPLIVIDMEEGVKDGLSRDYETHWDVTLFCIERDIHNLELSINNIENLFFLRRITITDRIIDENGDNYYKLDYRTLFNIRYREGVLTKKIDPRLINRDCR